MYRVLAIAVFLAAAVFPRCLEGQMRAIQRPRGPVRISAAPRVPVVRPAPSRFVAMSPHTFPGQALHRGRVALRHHPRSRIFFRNSGLGEDESNLDEELPFEERAELPSEERAEELIEELIGETVFLPYPVYAATPYHQVDEQAPATPDRESHLAREVDQLRYEVERLREEQMSRERAQQAALRTRPSVEEITSSTVLAFRDGRRSEIQNYAIVGQTLWVFTEQRARKIFVSDLDVEATKEVNAARGVEFRIP
jgi:hypothetical protein